MASKVSEISRKRRTIFALRWSTVLRDWAFVTSPPLQAKHRAMLASQQAPAQVAAFGKGLCLRLRVAHIHGGAEDIQARPPGGANRELHHYRFSSSRTAFTKSRLSLRNEPTRTGNASRVIHS
jgi:hypothetical protein